MPVKKMQLKLGRTDARYNAKRLWMSAFYDARTLRPAPATLDLTKGQAIIWGMMLNNILGCCTVSAIGHLIQLWRLWLTGAIHTVPDESIRALYNLVKVGQDGGANMLDVLNAMVKTGLDDHKILGYVGINVMNEEEWKSSTNLFGGTYFGLGMPLSAQTQFAAGQVWDIPAGQRLTGKWAPGSWGGHAMPVVGYGLGRKKFITWGKEQECTDRWWDTYVARSDSEGYALISQPGDWWDEASRMAANGVQYPEMCNAAAELARKPLPFPDFDPNKPPPIPTPIPTPGMSVKVSVLVNTTTFEGVLYPKA